MKISTVERLTDVKIIAGLGKNLLLFFSAVIYVGIFAMDYIVPGWFNYFDTKITIMVAGAYLTILPFIYAKNVLAFLFRSMPRWGGTVSLVIIAYLVCFFIVFIICLFVGIAFIVVRGIAIPLISFIAMAIYNVRISEITKLSGDLTAYVNNDKFLKKLDNIYESIDIFCELHWISKKKYDDFLKIYSVFCGFAESANNAADNISTDYTANTV